MTTILELETRDLANRPLDIRVVQYDNEIPGVGEYGLDADLDMEDARMPCSLRAGLSTLWTCKHEALYSLIEVYRACQHPDLESDSFISFTYPGSV